jgi:hypothetical protein
MEPIVYALELQILAVNDDETKVVLWEATTATISASYCFASFLQVRGSPPVFWMQDADAALPQPPIVSQRATASST